MKFSYFVILFFSFFFLLTVHAQRRPTTSDSSDLESNSRPTRRGRTRFTLSTEQTPSEDEKRPETVRRTSTRRRPAETPVASERSERPAQKLSIPNESPSRSSYVQSERQHAVTRPASIDLPSRNNYEVKEVLDEVPLDSPRSFYKPRTLTETKFEAHNAPPTNNLYQPSTTVNVDEALRSIGNFDSVTTESLSPMKKLEAKTPSALELSSSSELPRIENDISREITRAQTEGTRVQPENTPATVRKSPPDNRRDSPRRSNFRTRNSSTNTSPKSEESVTQQTPRGRGTRTRPTRPSTDIPSSTSASSRSPQRGGRRRLEASATSEASVSRTRGIPVFSSAEIQNLPSRTRTGRKITVASNRKSETPDKAERISIDLVPNSRFNSRRSSNRRSFDVAGTTEKISSREATAVAKSRSRFRDFPVTPPVIDEQKLEVLPLFEGETKIVGTTTPLRKNSFSSRRRSFDSADDSQISATDNNPNRLPRPGAEEILEKGSTQPSVIVSRRQTVSVETRTESSYRKKKPTRKPPVVKESVVSEFSEVTSKRTVNRRSSQAPKTTERRIKVDEPKVTVSEVITSSRGKKNRELGTSKRRKDKAGLTSSEEDIEESDNYPEPFKKRIQSKKQGHEESRTSTKTSSSSVGKVVRSSITSSSSTTSTTSTSSTTEPSQVADEIEDIANEVLPNPITTPLPRPTPRRFSHSPLRTREVPTRSPVTLPTRKPRTTKPLTASASVAKEHRFHARFNQPNKNEQEPTVSSLKPGGRGFSPKPPKGVYSSRKNKEVSFSSRSTPSPTQINFTTPKRPIRYSSRYRNEPRGAARTSTNAPAYLPTVPTVTPPSPSVKTSSEDKISGLDVITFDDPVNTIPSANLVSGEYVTSSPGKNQQANLLVSGSQTKITTEKPVSIIERIINSITAISTTEAVDSSTVPATLTQKNEPAENSAILRLASKKPPTTATKTDNTVIDSRTTQKTTFSPNSITTSEKPTTIIERILSSLSAIQAETSTTSTDTLKPTQKVRTNFNTISARYSPTTPSYNNRVTKSADATTSLPAQFSTTSSSSVNPMSILDEIENEQTLQKRTIGELLALLNSMIMSTTTIETPTVVVTPKATTASLENTSSFNPIQGNESIASRSQDDQETTVMPSTLQTTPVPSTSTNPVTVSPDTTTSSTQETITNATPTTSQLPSTSSFATAAEGSTISNEILTVIPETTTQTVITGKTSPAADVTTDSGVLPRFEVLNVTNLFTQTTPSLNSQTELGTSTSTEPAVDTETVFTTLSTIPPFISFEVSPGSVSVFSANDLLNTITPSDDFSPTVTISSRASFFDTATTPDSTTTAESETTTSSPSSVNSLSSSTEISPGTISPTSTESTTTTSITSNVTLATNTDATLLNNNSSNNSNTTNEITSEATTTPRSSTIAANASSTTAVGNLEPATTQSNIGSTNNMTQPNVFNNQSGGTTVSATNSTSMRFSNRSGRLLDIVQDSVQNSLDSSTERDKDYFIFAVLNNNTILRKRPSRFPNRETPFLVVGILPNNTVVKRFPNGTMVPMEPVIRVSGFDTRENPPPLPEITSNQVTSDQGGNRPDNTVDQNTIPSVEANPLSLSDDVNNVNSITTESGQSSTTIRSESPNVVSTTSSPSTSIDTPNSSSTISSTTSSTASTTALPSSTTPLPVDTSSATTARSVATTSATTTAVTLPTLTEILNGRTVQAFNSIINISDLVKTLDVDPKQPITTTLLPTTVSLSNRILDSSGASSTPVSQESTTVFVAPTTTTQTTTEMSTTPTTTQTTSTVVPITPPATITTSRTTTGFPSTTFFPTFLTTLFSTMQPRRPSTTLPPRSTTLPVITTTPLLVTTTPGPVETTRTPDLAPASTTAQISTVTPFTTAPVTTNSANSASSGSQLFTSAPNGSAGSTLSPKQLSEQQIKDLQTLAELEKEQAEILKQLAFLTNLNSASTRPSDDRNSLANRIIQLAVERNQNKASVTMMNTLSAENNRQGKSLQVATNNNPNNIEDVFKQLNIVTPSTSSGRSEDAVIAQLLKEQGIGPTTPKGLENIYIQTTTTTVAPTTTTTRKPKTTTRPKGPLMQSLNWLLNALQPSTTTRKPKAQTPRPSVEPNPEELLTHQPTKVAPVVTSAPPARQNAIDNLSQEEVRQLIKQLEAIQKNPNTAGGLDLSQVKSLQTLLVSTEEVQVTSSGSTGNTPRSTLSMSTTTSTTETVRPIFVNSARSAKSATTAIPLSVSNSIGDDADELVQSTTTLKPRSSLPPVKLRPIPGVDESDSLVRGQLISAAVNVTRAISQFLGSALQGAASGFQTLMSSGSRAVGSLIRGSSSSGPG